MAGSIHIVAGPGHVFVERSLYRNLALHHDGPELLFPGSVPVSALHKIGREVHGGRVSAKDHLKVPCTVTVLGDVAFKKRLLREETVIGQFRQLRHQNLRKTLREGFQTY